MWCKPILHNYILTERISFSTLLRLCFFFYRNHFPGKRFSHFPLFVLPKVENNFPLKKKECHIFLFSPLNFFIFPPIHLSFPLLYSFFSLQTQANWFSCCWNFNNAYPKSHIILLLISLTCLVACSGLVACMNVQFHFL